MAIERDALSPLIHSKLFQIEETVFWDQTRPPEIGARDDDIEYYIKSDDRMDTLAFTKLGSSQLWWVIMRRNDLMLFPNDFVQGLKIFIPTRKGLVDRGII